MLDFFKDIYAELNGLDLDKIQEEKKAKREKLDKRLQGYGKLVIVIVGVLYLIIAGTNVSMMFSTGFDISLVKYIILSLLDIAALTTVFMNNKRAKIASIILISIFIFLNFALIRL